MTNIEDSIEIKRAGFTFEYAILTNDDGAVEMLLHKDPVARCLIQTWERFEPHLIREMDLEAQEIADGIYKEWLETPAKSNDYQFGFTR